MPARTRPPDEEIRLARRGERPDARAAAQPFEVNRGACPDSAEMPAPPFNNVRTSRTITTSPSSTDSPDSSCGCRGVIHPRVGGTCLDVATSVADAADGSQAVPALLRNEDEAQMRVTSSSGDRTPPASTLPPFHLLSIATNVCLNRIRDGAAAAGDSKQPGGQPLKVMAIGSTPLPRQDAWSGVTRMVLDWLFNRHPESAARYTLHYVMPDRTGRARNRMSGGPQALREKTS